MANVWNTVNKYQMSFTLSKLEINGNKIWEIKQEDLFVSGVENIVFLYTIRRVFLSDKIEVN